MAKKKPPVDHWLVHDLEDALFEFKLDHPLLGQLAALKAIARHVRKRVPEELLEPLESLYTDLMNQAAAMTADDKPGPHPAPLDRRTVEN